MVFEVIGGSSSFGEELQDVPLYGLFLREGSFGGSVDFLFRGRGSGSVKRSQSGGLTVASDRIEFDQVGIERPVSSIAREGGDSLQGIKDLPGGIGFARSPHSAGINDSLEVLLDGDRILNREAGLIRSRRGRGFTSGSDIIRRSSAGLSDWSSAWLGVLRVTNIAVAGGRPLCLTCFI